MRTVTSFLQTQLVIHCCYAAIDEKEVFGDNGNKVIVDNDARDNQIMFNERGLDQQAQSAFENVEFNLQNRGPDKVTYGCLGRFNEYRELISQLYLIDALGFRLINSSTFAVASKSKYVIPSYEKNSSDFFFKSLSIKSVVDSRGEFKQIKDLHFPKGCKSLKYNLNPLYQTMISSLARSFSLPSLENGDSLTPLAAQTVKRQVDDEFSQAFDRRRSGRKNDGFYYPDYSGRYIHDNRGAYVHGKSFKK